MLPLRKYSGRNRPHDPDGSSPSGPVDPDQRPVSRSVSLTFHPMRSSTLATVITTDRGGMRRWDRVHGTLIVPVGVDELAGLDTSEVLRILLRATLDG